MNVKQISVGLNNSPGTVLEMSRVLFNNNIELRAITVAESSTFTIVRVIVDNILWASSVLKEAGFTVSLNDVIAIKVPDIPEGFTKVLEVLNNAGINIDYMYEICGRRTQPGKSGIPLLVFKVDDVDAAVEAFTSAGIRVLGQGELSAV